MIGFVNGFFIAVVGISSFVATFGMLFTLDGLTLVISHSAPVSTPGTSSLHVEHVRAGVRRRHLLRADLGAGASSSSCSSC